MVCGLFSSFDPGSISFFSKEIIFIKWMTVMLISSFFSWQIFLKSSSMNVMINIIFSFIWSTVNDISSSPKKIFLLLFSIFFFFLSVNFLGLIPYSFSLSAHLSVNLSLSLSLWMSGILFSLVSSLNSFFSHLVPLGSPIFLWPLLVLVESVSLIIRPFTLAIRLMANVMAGHLIMSLIGSFLSSSSQLLLFFFSFSFFLMFEIIISGVQAYVFMSLLSLYWKESE